MRQEIEQIIEKHLDLDTVHIEWHREAVNPVGRMAEEILVLVETKIDDAVESAIHQTERAIYETTAGEDI